MRTVTDIIEDIAGVTGQVIPEECSIKMVASNGVPVVVTVRRDTSPPEDFDLHLSCHNWPNCDTEGCGERNGG